MKIKNIFNKVAVALGATATIFVSSCSDNDCPNYWDKHYGPYQLDEKPRYIWIDAAANSFYVLNNKEGITEYVTKARKAGFTHLIVDVRGSNGDALFKTDRVDQAEGFWQWKRNAETNTSTYEFCQNERSFDYLQAWIDEGHKQGVKVLAAMNIMVGGQRASNGSTSGLVFRDPDKKDWVTTLNMPDQMSTVPGHENEVEVVGGLKNMLDTNLSGEIFLNPHNPDVQDFIVGIVGDLAANYADLDGIILDRTRFLDLRSDFSTLTRSLFEDEVGRKLSRWPGDVFPSRTTTLPTSANKPRYYEKWWTFRAQCIHDLIGRIADEVHAKNANIEFGCYVGAWYGTYYQNGVNWASTQFDPTSVTSFQFWANNDYHKTGYADLIDILLIGCYADPDAVYGMDKYSVEQLAVNGMARTLGACKTIGGPDLGHWPTANGNYILTDKTQPAEFYHQALTNALSVCLNSCDGSFVFDIIHLQNSPEYWNDAKAASDLYFDEHGVDRPYEK